MSGAKHTPMVLRAARALSDASAASCNVDAEDNWKTYSDDFIADATAALDAAGATELLAALKSAEYAVNVTRACLMDSVETHGTNGGWLHTEALRLDSELDLIRAAIAKATGGAA